MNHDLYNVKGLQSSISLIYLIPLLIIHNNISTVRLQLIPIDAYNNNQKLTQIPTRNAFKKIALQILPNLDL